MKYHFVQFNLGVLENFVKVPVFLKDEEHRRRISTAVISENIAAVGEMIIKDHNCT